MPTLLVVGAGLFGSQAAAYARLRGYETLVFDPGVEGSASPAAAGLFKEDWAGAKLQDHYHRALPVLEQLYGIRHVALSKDDGTQESFLFVPPTAILERDPIRERVTSVGDGWLEAAGRRHQGYVYIAAGVWTINFVANLRMTAKAGAAFTFPGEREGRIRPIDAGRQSIAFVRDEGATYFSDGTAETDYRAGHDRQTLERAESLGLTGPPLQRYWGRRPYLPGGPLFRRLRQRTWVATGGRKMGTILGASFAQQLVDVEFGESSFSVRAAPRKGPPKTPADPSAPGP